MNSLTWPYTTIIVDVRINVTVVTVYEYTYCIILSQ